MDISRASGTGRTKILSQQYLDGLSGHMSSKNQNVAMSDVLSVSMQAPDIE